jgi:nitronate monooxygenase
MKGDLTVLLPNLKHPIIMAPMFLVSNNAMVIEATKHGITGAIPALNYRTSKELEKGIIELKENCKGPFGINLIVNKSNIYFNDQLKICCRLKVDYIITSLGSPRETIIQAHKVGIKVFCDVTDLHFAKKVEEMGADAVIAVNNNAGGHAGKYSANSLISELKTHCGLPIISAGGVGDNKGVKEILRLGASGLSIGTVFMASEEADISNEYKNALVKYSASDIVKTTKLSGTPCTVINTPYVKQIGLKQNLIEKILQKNRFLKKWLKAFAFYKGMKSLKQAAFSTTYKTVWCAGPSIEFTTSIRPLKAIISDLIYSDEHKHQQKTTNET